MTETKLVYHWKGIDSHGKRVNGISKANDLKEAQNELKQLGIEVISLEGKPQISIGSIKIFSKQKKIKSKDILLFTRYISTLLSSGLSIVQTLDIIAQDQENPNMKTLILTIKSRVEGGKSLAEAFSEHPKQFNDLYCSLLKAGEQSGTIDKILNRLAHYLERTEQLTRKVKKALVYPIAILTVALIVSLILLLFVVPQFEKMFKTFGADLPLFTRMVVDLSQFMRHYWWLLLGAAFGGIWLLRKSLRESQKIRRLRDRWVLKIYVIGQVIKNSIIARFTRTLATTLEAGMPIVESMKSMAPVMGNALYRDAILKIADEVVSGNKLSEAMRETKLFPNMMIQMIAVGEASGSLSGMLNKVADYYEEEVNTTVDNLSSLLEPLIMLVLGVVVGGFVVAMYLPIFKIGSLF